MKSIKLLKYYIINIITIVVILLSSCTKEELRLEDISNQNQDIEVIVRERNKSIPLSINQSPFPTVSRYSSSNIEDFVGGSFKLEYFPEHNPHNLGYEVIDINSLRGDHSGYFRIIPMNTSVTTSMSFYDFDRLETKLEAKYFSDTGFSIDLGLLKYNSQLSFSAAFSNHQVSQTESIFGLSRISYQKNKYTLNISNSDVIEQINRHYLSNDYLYMLHHSSDDQFVEEYGQYVLTEYTTGGSANALFLGRKVDETNETIASFELAMKQNISFFWSSDSSPSQTSLSGGGYVSDQSLVSDIMYSVYTEGGLPSFAINTNPVNLGASSINLSSWANSLANDEFLVLSHVETAALIPITSFVEEENLRENIERTIENGIGTSTLQEPEITISIIMDTTLEKTFVGTKLRTRRGENLLIRTLEYPISNTNPILPTTIRQIELDYINQYFPDIAVTARIQNGIMPRNIELPEELPQPIIPEYHEFDIRYMRKIVDPIYGKLYLLCETEDNEKFAYTLYDEDIIDDYTFADFIHSLPEETTLTINQIRDQYTLIAL